MVDHAAIAGTESNAAQTPATAVFTEALDVVFAASFTATRAPRVLLKMTLNVLFIFSDLLLAK